MSIIPKPTVSAVNTYLNKWPKLRKYAQQEQCLSDIFKQYPKNVDIKEILIKCALLNEFYSTNIYSIYDMAEHILNLNIDERLQKADLTLINDIANITIKGKEKHFGSFASKYCNHHFHNDFPIYDSYVKKVLIYFQEEDSFDTCCLKISHFKKKLNNYEEFCEVLIKFQNYYKLTKFSVKEIDIYLWQLGKEYFPNNI